MLEKPPQLNWDETPFGINLIGFATGNLGLGVTLRNTATLLEKKGIPFCVIDVNPGGGRHEKDLTLKHRIHPSGDSLPYLVNLFHINPPEIEILMAGEARKIVEFDSKMNVCIPFWELPQLPPSWLPTLKKMDCILAPSRFIHDAIKTQIPEVPAFLYQQGLSTLAESLPNRNRWNLPEDKTVFLTLYDIGTDMARKNPMGALEAFRNFASNSPNSLLVLKTNNQSMNSRTQEIGSGLKNLERIMPNLRVINETLTYPEIRSLLRSSDIFVSLHRGEAVGLSLLEAMSLGKPVIATGWSGNMDFMDETNACLVNFSMTDIPPDSSYHGLLEGIPQPWAEPNLDTVAAWMQLLATNEPFRKSIGEMAAQSAKRFVEKSWQGEAFDALHTFAMDKRALIENFYKNSSQGHANPSPRFSVVIQIREDMRILPGGDTVLVDAIQRGLKARGIHTRVALSWTESFKSKDIVQLMNITRAQDTFAHMENAKKQGKIKIVIPLFEDLDRYFIEGTRWFSYLFQLAQQKTRLPFADLLSGAKAFHLDKNPLEAENFKEFGIGDAKLQEKILSGVDHILTSGKQETELLKKRFKFSAPISELHYGINLDIRQANGALFTAKYGFKDFVLCVGRIEMRKNQLLLIEIFRNLPELQLVLIGFFGNSTDEPIVRSHIPKNVHILNRVSKEELWSAYAAARVHALASWYELPGLVSLEAAAAGARIVTTSWGTAKDYFGDRVDYCEPDNPDSIRKAILEANDRSHGSELKDFVLEKYSWERTAQSLDEYYQSIHKH